MPPKKDAKGKAGAKGGKTQAGGKGKKDLFGKPKSQGGSNKNKKKWGKTRVKDKLDNLVLFNQETYDKFNKEVPSMKVITPAAVSDRFKITLSLAKVGLKELEKKGAIVPVSVTRHLMLYTRSKKEAPKAEEKQTAPKKKQQKK